MVVMCWTRDERSLREVKGTSEVEMIVGRAEGESIMMMEEEG